MIFARWWPRDLKVWRVRLVASLFVATQLCSLFGMFGTATVYAETPPTLSNFQTSTWSDLSSGSEVTPTLTWSSGDLIIVVGGTESGSWTINTPTATGLSFSLVTSVGTGDGSNTTAYMWSATAGSGGSSAITSTVVEGGSAARGIAAYAYSGSGGLGNTGTIVGSSSKTINLTRGTANSAVVAVLNDWQAVSDTTVNTSPAGGTVRVAQESPAHATFFSADWGDQGSTGTTSYGITDHTGTVDMAGIVLEVEGLAGGSTIEQEGYRWRSDDGSESAATWLAAQDTNITQPSETNTRLRMLLNTTGDAASTQYRLDYKRSDQSVYGAVPTALPAAGAVTYGAVGTFATSAGATSRNPALPTGVTAQSELWASVASKNNATHSSSTTGWTKVAQQNSGASWTVSLWRYTGADATAAASVTVTWTGSVASHGQCWRMQGRTGTDPLGTPSVNNGTTSTHSTTAVTTTSPGSRVMYVDAAAANTAIAQPTSWTENFDNGSATSASRLAVGGRDFSSSGSSSGAISVTGAAAAWVQWQVELPAPQPAILLSASSNIAASGANTTVQLTAPSGKSTSDFVAGRIQDDENPADAVDITTDDYTEMEWSLKANGSVVSNTQIYQFRVTSNGVALNTYTVTPEWTIGTANTAPSSPASAAQKKTDDTTLATGAWTNETSIKLTATVTDSDGGDTVKICAEVDPVGTAFTSPAGDGDGCSTIGVSSGGTATVTIAGLSTDTEYHWQIKAKDAAGAYSSWVTYGGNTENPPTNPADRDFGVDTSAPTGGTVYDGTTTDVDKSLSDASLSQLSANWSGFSFTSSGILKYEYSIGTTAGATDVKNWTDNSTTASVTATGLTLQTSQMYFFNVRASDNAGNTVTRSSNGQIVAPSLSFAVSPSTITFDNVNAGNSYTNTKDTTLTTSTNAYGGYVVRAFATDFLRSADNYTVSNFNGGTYASPDTWGGSDTGFGYTSSDTSVQGSNKFQVNPCPGGTALASPGCYAPFSASAPGDIIADHTSNVTGTPITDQAFTITLRATVNATQQAARYQTILVYTITPLY